LCPSAKNVNPRKARKYKSRDAALDDGLSPCRQCRP
jgi:methylphosphotriester-DNA--protein-cysteine methyltransferase